MIELKNVSKNFGDVKAVDNICLAIRNNTVMGLLGTNGAGKSTLLRMMAGVLKPDDGEILIDEIPVWNNPQAKGKFFYISDDQYYFPNSTPKEFGSFYKTYYPDFDEERFHLLLDKIDLPADRKIRTFSKGMKKQLSILIGICAETDYLFCDETFDGLDPVMRQAIKAIFIQEMERRSFTPVIASHNLRELEDISDHIGLLHKGGVLLSQDLEDLKCNLTKIQCVLPEELDEKIQNALLVLKMQRHGKLLTMTVRGETEKVVSWLNTLNPIYCEAVPLTLEEIFISETEVAGYDIKSLIS
ncbi:MAG: ABC transporter ATP-binding protein [Tyzzerella sp.]|nr:ABC transporter ATP-binding protein [Tyzzerella sp.]